MNKDSTTMAVQVQEFLEKEGYALPDARGGKAMLSYTLLLLLHPAPPNLLSKGIRAVTTLMECKEARQSTETIVAMVLWKLDPVLNAIDHAVDQAQGAMADTRKAADQLYRTVEEMRD